MAGKPGRSGGPRPNSGGARPGAGRPPKETPPPTPTDKRDPLEFLLDVMQGLCEPSPDQLKAAIAATQYLHAKKGDGGKKEGELAAAKKVASKYAVSTPPRLIAAGGKKV